MKYKVQAQTLVEVEIEAEDQDEAEEKGFQRILEEFELNDELDWCVSAYPLDENGKIIWNEIHREKEAV